MKICNMNLKGQTIRKVMGRVGGGEWRKVQTKSCKEKGQENNIQSRSQTQEKSRTSQTKQTSTNNGRKSGHATENVPPPPQPLIFSNGSS